jgi:hypothetical protein
VDPSAAVGEKKILFALMSVSSAQFTASVEDSTVFAPFPALPLIK